MNDDVTRRKQTLIIIEQPDGGQRTMPGWEEIAIAQPDGGDDWQRVEHLVETRCGALLTPGETYSCTNPDCKTKSPWSASAMKPCVKTHLVCPNCYDADLRMCLEHAKKAKYKAWKKFAFSIF